MLQALALLNGTQAFTSTPSPIPLRPRGRGVPLILNEKRACGPLSLLLLVLFLYLCPYFPVVLAK